MEEVKRIVLDALKQHESIHILGDIPAETLPSENYLTSTQKTMYSHLRLFLERPSQQPTLTRRGSLRQTYFVLDFNNDNTTLTMHMFK